MNKYRLEPFDRTHPAMARELGRLHIALLPSSPVVLLGERFIESFYYPTLMKMDLLFGAIAYVDDKPVGFISATDDASGFMGRAIVRYPLKLAWTLFVSVLLDPARISALYEAWQIMRGRKGQEETDERIAELLSFGVLPEYRSIDFVRSTGIKVGQDLFDFAIEQLKDRSVNTVAALVDQDNLEVAMTYRARGWHVHDPDVSGWKVPQIEFRTELGPGQTD